MAEETKFEATVHLKTGGKFEVYRGLTPDEVQTVYNLLGREDARLRFPIAADTMIYMDPNNVDFVEVRGAFV